jgi:CTP:molybdopterin cytidylyltransferase MocA
LYPEIHQLQGDLGARDLFIKYNDNVCLVEPEEDYNDRDIDTLDDYLEFKKSLDHV